MSELFSTNIMLSRERFVREVSSSLTAKEHEGESKLQLLSSTVLMILLELVFSLLKALPLSNIANIQRKISPLLQFDIVGVRC